MQKRVAALRELRRILSRSEFPPIETALTAGAISVLVQCLSFGSPDEQVGTSSYVILLKFYSSFFSFPLVGFAFEINGTDGQWLL